MIRRPPTPTRTDTPLPYTPLFRSAPEQHRRARKTPTIGDTHLRDQGAQASLQGEGAGVEHPAPGHPVGIARAPAAALGEIDHRQAPLLGEFKEPVGLFMILHALGASQHGVVVRQHHAARRLRAELFAVPPPDARDPPPPSRCADLTASGVSNTPPTSSRR